MKRYLFLLCAMIILPSMLIAQNFSKELEVLKRASDGEQQDRKPHPSRSTKVDEIDLPDLAESLKRDRQQKTQNAMSSRLAALKKKCSEAKNDIPEPVLDTSGILTIFTGSCDAQCKESVRRRDRRKKEARYEIALSRWREEKQLRQQQRSYCESVSSDLAAGIIPTENVPAWSNADEARFSRLAANIQIKFENEQRDDDTEYQTRKASEQAENDRLERWRQDQIQLTEQEAQQLQLAHQNKLDRQRREDEERKVCRSEVDKKWPKSSSAPRAYILDFDCDDPKNKGTYVWDVQCKCK